MSSKNCIICLKKSTEIPPEYRQICHELFLKLFKNISTDINRFETIVSSSFPFCSPCRIYLVKVTKLDEQLTSLVGGLQQLNGKQTAKIIRISSIQSQVGENVNDAQEQLDKLEVEQEHLEDRLEKLENQLEKLEDLLENLQTHRGPKKPAQQKFSESVRQVSEKEFLFKGKYSFERRDFGFKCGSCPAVSKLCDRKSLPVWYSIIKHIKKWHVDSGRIRKMKIQQKFIEIAPNRFQYGSYLVVKTDSKLKCLTCDHLASIGLGKSKFKYIGVHIDKKHENPGKNYICELCGAQYRSSQAVRLHKISKHEQLTDSHPCSRCGKLFKTRFQVSQHEKNVHGGRRLKYLNHICETCGKRFQDRQVMQDHIAFFHNGQRELKCNGCGKTFASRTSLSTHQNSHTGKRKYACDICGMNFTQIYSVTRHKSTAHKN